MKCDECDSRDNYFDERLGERVCNSCGLVLVVEKFEETVRFNFDNSSSDNYGRLGSQKVNLKQNSLAGKISGMTSQERSIMNGINSCSMVFTSLKLPFDLRERTDRTYRQLNNSGVFQKSSFEVRATALVYYLLRENGTPMSLDDVCAEFSVKKNQVNKLVRRITKFFGARPAIQYRMEYEMRRYAERLSDDNAFPHLCIEMMNYFDKVSEKHYINNGATYPYAIIAMCSRMHNYSITQKKIAEIAPVSENGIRACIRRLLEPIGMKYTELRGKTIRDLEKLL